jgi:hypothetical protein
MPYGDFINNFPPTLFLLVHLVAFLVGAYLAYRSFDGAAPLLGWGFTLYALAEISYMTYHLDWTVFLFAHTISEVLDLFGFVLVFAGAARSLAARTRVDARREATPS